MRVDVMINNAELMPQAPLERLKIDEWNRMIDVNIKGTQYGTAAALPYMKQAESWVYAIGGWLRSRRPPPGRQQNVN